MLSTSSPSNLECYLVSKCYLVSRYKLECQVEKEKAVSDLNLHLPADQHDVNLRARKWAKKLRDRYG
jgi:hypothetical protein